ncbi:timeless protein-domain-containing protein [Cokeromyces recurvatus]|uniref:timeless protein-domain-containing protein n=1 Tax=Cokeromyces recurvatus TaxID=90255 RepID=UPI00221F1730|nr:timeless protein-domain-containing protein [Cokeromyces recurvatus]KAI7903689.1 timeless protein-domain-containing protein [Cokeromyces recurvatus]
MDDDLTEIEKTKAYILNLCSAIGGLEEVKQEDGSITQIYCVGDEALACLRDLKKAIRLDSQNNEKIVLNALVEYNVIETDIVPLILSFRHQRNDVAHRFILACVELLVPMTWPIEKRQALEEQEEEENPNIMHCYRKYKLDLLTEGVFETILTMIMKSVRIPHRDRSVVDHTTIRLALYLFRNLTAIPDLNTSLSGATSEQIRMAHMQEKLMIRYYEADVIEFLLTIASNSERQEGTSEWNVLVLESLFNLLKHVDTKDVFLYQFSEREKRGELYEISAKLSNLLTEETKLKRQKINHVSSRHNRFGGTYVLDWDGKRRISHRQEAGYADAATLIEGEKKINRIGVKRKLEENITKRKVYENRKALMYLKLTAQSFIVSCFNAFYDSLLKDMQREDAKIVDQDYVRYYFTMRWFLEYFHYEQRNNNKQKAQNQLILPNQNESSSYFSDQVFDFALIASAINLRTVLFCLRQMRIKLDEKAWLDVQTAADCLRYMLVIIGSMSVVEDEDSQEYREIAEHIQQNLFYEQTSFELFVDIIKCYKSQSYGYLKAVIMLTHVFLKLLDHYQKSKKMMFIRKRTNKKAKKKMIDNNIKDDDDEEEEEASIKEDEKEYKDSVFKFSAFEQKYINWDVVIAYCTLLECYQDLEPEYLTCITTMFHRMMVKRKAEYLFWKLPVLELFNRILIDFKNIPSTQKTREMGQLEEFIRYAVYQFFKGAKEYPLLFVEALVPSIKSNRTMWEISPPPTEEELRRDEEEAKYLADVNYIPTNDNNEDEQHQSSNNDEEEDLLDEDMMDYYFSEFDKQKEREEEAAKTTSGQSDKSDNHDEIVPNQSDSIIDNHRDTPKVDLRTSSTSLSKVSANASSNGVNWDTFFD